MTQAGDRATIVDGDLRRPQQHEIFDLPNQAGLSNWLSDGGPAPLQRTSLEGLQVMTSGPLPANPVALLSNRRLADALTELQEQADYLLIDVPPILAVTGRGGREGRRRRTARQRRCTKRDHAQRAKTVLEKVRFRIVGAVLLDAERDAAMSGYNW